MAPLKLQDDAVRKAKEDARILVVDEDNDACDIMVQALAFLGYPAHCVTNASDALRLGADTKYAAIFTELILQGLSGFDLFHALRRAGANQSTPVIALSAYQEYRQRAKEVGFTAFVAKPIELSRLRPVLDQQAPLRH